DALDGMRHLYSLLKPMSPEVEDVEAVQFRLALQQLRDGGGDVWQVGPRVAGIRLARVHDGAHRFAGLDQALRKPAVAGAWAEEVTGSHNECTQAVAAGGLEAFLHLDADPALAR